MAGDSFPGHSGVISKRRVNMRIVGCVGTRELRPGMIISKPGNKDTEKVPPLNEENPACQKGVHFGNGCYDRIAQWFVWR